MILFYTLPRICPELVIPSKKIPLLAESIVKGTPIPDPLQPKKVPDLDRIFNPYNIPPTDYTKIGSYVIFWDGFDENDIYDSTKFDNKKFKAKIIAKKNGKEKIKEVEFSTKYSKVDWVDVKIDKKSKRIDTTLRVNLKDGGEEGLQCTTHLVGGRDETKWETKCPWDKIPKETLLNSKKEPIKKRTKSFADLEKLAIEGLNYHWGRNTNHAVAKDFKILDLTFEIFMNSINQSEKAMKSVDLVYNTNNYELRSNNPGNVNTFTSLLANIAKHIPYVPLSGQIYYNVGYVNINYAYESEILMNKDNWKYIDFSNINVEKDFSYASAHELGHSILKAYAEKGGGSTDYSYQHKGSSGYSDVTPVSKGGVNYPKNNEIDLMLYYNNDPKALDYDFDRIVATEKDILGLIWLTKLNIK